MSEVVLRVMLVLAEDLNSRSTGDAILGGQVTICHDIDCAKSDVLTIMSGLLGSILKFRLEGPAVRAEVSVVSDNPGVFLVVDNLITKVFSGKSLDIVVEGNDGGGEVSDSGGDTEELHYFSL